jgi:hypothetical protein
MVGTVEGEPLAEIPIPRCQAAKVILRLGSEIRQVWNVFDVPVFDETLDDIGVILDGIYSRSLRNL